MSEIKNKDKNEQEYNVFLKNNEKYYAAPTKTYNVRQMLIVIACLNIVLAIVLLIINTFVSNHPTSAETNQPSFWSSLMEKLKPTTKEHINFNLFKKRKNILVVGVDKNDGNKNPFLGTRSDTILIVTLDPSQQTISVISVPRDSKVYISEDHGIQKINSAHALGGIKLTKKTLEETLGVKFDHYIAIHNEGVVKLVDAIGGIPAYVEKDMYYNDNAQNLHINLKKGLQVLDGKQAEGYIRYRHDALGDIGRTSRQQWFLKGVVEKLQTPATITKIPEVIQIATNYTQTDMSVYDLTQLVSYLKGVDLSDIEVATLPGSPSKKGSISYWILDPEKTQEVINRLVYKDNTTIDNKKLVAGIMYAPSKEAVAMTVKSKLESYGYEVNCTGRANLPHSQVLTHNTAVSNEFINWLKKKIPEVKHSQFVYDPIRMYCVKSDFTIVIADN